MVFITVSFFFTIIVIGLTIYKGVIKHKAEKQGGFDVTIVNTTRGLACFVLFEKQNGERISLQVPNVDFPTYVVGEKGVLKYSGTTFVSFDRKVS